MSKLIEKKACLNNDGRKEMPKRGLLRRSAYRAARGQALVESAVGLTIMSFVFVMMVMFAINLYAVMMSKAKLELVAAEIAKNYLGHEYFLGMRRQGFNSNTAAANAETLANALCSQLGIPPLASSPTFTEETSPDGSIYVVCEISGSVSIPYTNTMLPSSINMKATAVSADSGMAMAPPAVVNVQGQSHSPNRQSWITGQMPAYGLAVSADGQSAGTTYGLGERPAGAFPYYYTGFHIPDAEPMLAGTGDGSWGKVVDSHDNKEKHND